MLQNCFGWSEQKSSGSWWCSTSPVSINDIMVEEANAPEGGGRGSTYNAATNTVTAPFRRRRHSVDGRGTSEKLNAKIKAETSVLIKRFKDLRLLADAHWHCSSNLDAFQLGTLKMELKRLQSGCATIGTLVQVLDQGQNLRRWADAHIQMINLVAKRFYEKEQQTKQQSGSPDKARSGTATAYSAEQTRSLLGCGPFDGITFDVKMKDRQGIESVLNAGADPMATDKLRKTCAHDLALAGILPFQTDTWHAVRLQSLKKRGADLRTSRDCYGRAPILIALEEHNVAFLRAILRVEAGFSQGASLQRKWRNDEENLADSTFDKADHASEIEGVSAATGRKTTATSEPKLWCFPRKTKYHPLRCEITCYAQESRVSRVGCGFGRKSRSEAALFGRRSIPVRLRDYSLMEHSTAYTTGLRERAI
ncbi:unnamed protein product [Amoebophrya sp. A25]|nr:unnamed protein product [Amoebophrya sp. A25]|eukprot:GSA25T00008806001.1